MLSVMCYSDGKLTKATSLRFDFHLIDPEVVTDSKRMASSRHNWTDAPRKLDCDSIHNTCSGSQIKIPP